MLEAGGLQRILNHLRHLDDPLLQCSAVSTLLLTRSIANVCCLTNCIRHVLGLGSFNLASDQLFESLSSPFGSGLNFLFGRSIHGTLIIGDVFPVGKRDKVFELRLYDLSGSLALVCDGIVSNVALGIDLEGKGVSRLCLGDG